jgi:hypothetical protein
VRYQTDNALQHSAASILAMQEWLQLIDGEYYRAMRLLLVRAELEHLRHGNSASTGGEPLKIALGTSSSSSVDCCRELLAQEKNNQSL